MLSATYTLHPCCRVRKEAFGLLFYDLRGPRLLFAETGDLVGSEDLRAGISVEAAAPAPARARLARLLSDLTRKGFLREQSVC